MRTGALRALICLAAASAALLAGLVFAGSAAALGTETTTPAPTEEATSGSTTEAQAPAAASEAPAAQEGSAVQTTPETQASTPAPEEGSAAQTPAPETPAQTPAPEEAQAQAPPAAEAPAPPPAEAPAAPAPAAETPVMAPVTEEGGTKAAPEEEHQTISKSEETPAAGKSEETKAATGTDPLQLLPVYDTGSATPPQIQIAIGPLSTPSEPAPPLLMIAASEPTTAEAIARHAVAQREQEAACELSLAPAGGSCTGGWLAAPALLSAAGSEPVYATVTVVVVPWTTTVVGLPHTVNGSDGAGYEPAGSHPAGPSQAPPPSGASGGAPAGGSSAAPSLFLTLAGLLLLAAPRAMRRMRLRCRPWLTAFFVLIPERPG